MLDATESFQAERGGHAGSFKSGSTQRCYGRAGVLSACELSSEAQRAAIHQAVMDFTLAFMSSLAGRGRGRGREGGKEVGISETENRDIAQGAVVWTDKYF